MKVLAGDLEPSKCKLLGNGTGTAPLLPGQWVSISIASYDSLDNKRKQGGGTDRFSFLVCATRLCKERDTLLNSCACVCVRACLNATQQVRRIPYQSAHQPEPPEWIGHHSLTVDDRGDGSYSLSYCMEHVGIFECRIQYDDKVIQDGEFTCCVISGTLQWQQYQGTTCTHSGDMVQRKRRVPSHRSWPRRRPIGR